MENFAERYYLQNRDTFASADMAFILAFSTIMLQTNLHNPAIREDKRMTREQFIKQNKGISSDGELSDELLIEIYNRIEAEPISISVNDKFKAPVEKPASFAVFQPSKDKKRLDAFNHERMEMVKAGEALFKLKSGKVGVFVRQVTSEMSELYARPMFDIAWAPILGSLSEILGSTDEQSVTDLCLICFQFAIRLACRLDFPTAKSTFVNALCKFTTLDSVREMSKKNVDSIKVLLDVVLNEGDYLGECWTQVFHVVSHLARLQLFAGGLHTDDMFFSDNVSVNSMDSNSNGWTSNGRKNSGHKGSISKDTSGLGSFAKLFLGPTRAETTRIIEESNAEMIMREIEPFMIDKIYVNSKNLSEDSVNMFLQSLCEVSMLEISASSAMSFRSKDSNIDMSTPRIFSLQKLVEVADYNMGIRGRIAWGQMWNKLASHFTTVGVHDNHALAMFAIDSLKQLSIKFLQKAELSNFNFQRLFLKPFEIIIQRTRYDEIKDLVLRCIDIMIRACANNIRSGWKSIFSIFEVAASQETVEIANIAFDITDRLITQQFQLLIYDFVELINCLVTFVGSTHIGLSLKVKLSVSVTS
jgi:brefeldin A-inhibited guanine nucleotide-exchange protein